MNTPEPLNHDAVIALDNWDDKFNSASATFRPIEMRTSLFHSIRSPQDKWFFSGVACEALLPNCSWRRGKAILQFCFIEDQPEDNEQESQEDETESTPSLFNHSMGSLEILSNTGVVSLDEQNDKFTTINRTCLLSQIGAIILRSYGPDELGYKWFVHGVPCSVLTPNNSWRKGMVRLQAGFIEDLVEEELVEEEVVEIEEAETTSDETGLDTTTEVLSPLDEIRQMAAEPS
jgi:KGK domain